MLDCTPLNLVEAETYCFSTKQVSIYDCQPSIRDGAQHIVQDSLGKLLSVVGYNLEGMQKDLDKQLEHFSNTRLKELVGATLGTAVAKATLQVPNMIHGAKPYNAWIEYWGIEQSIVDGYPDWLRKQIYTKYIDGFDSIDRKFRDMSRNSQIKYLDTQIKNALRIYLGRRSDRITYECMRNEIQHVLADLGLYGNVDYHVDSRQVQFTVETDSPDARAHVLCGPNLDYLDDYLMKDRRSFQPMRVNIQIDV